MPNREFYDCIIVGGGPGGLTAAIYALRASMRTLLVENAVTGGQVTKSDVVENYPGFLNISGYELSQRLLEHALHYRLEILSREIRTLKPGLEAHQVQLDDGSWLKAHAVVLAAGGSPRKLNVPGECETNIPGIFVIGDLREKYARQIVLSAADGCTAALAAAHYVEAKRAPLP